MRRRGHIGNYVAIVIHDGILYGTFRPHMGGVPIEIWESYGDVELHLYRIRGNGTDCWMQDTASLGGIFRLIRGRHGNAYVSMYECTTENDNFGWRPALRINAY